MQGCLTCKDRHIKCDEGRPICQNCIKVNKECVQRDGSRARPSSVSGDTTAANTSNTTPPELVGATTTVNNLSVVPEESNTSESAKTANTDSNTNSNPLSKYKESEIDSNNQDHDINKLTQSIKELRYPQNTIMTQKISNTPKNAVPHAGSDKNIHNSATTSKPSDMEMKNNKQTSKPAPSVKFVSPLPLASTTTNRPPPASFTALKPIHHWVPPRPAIIARTELSDAEKPELRVEDTVRKAEKEAAKLQKEREVEMMVTRAKEAQMQIRAQALGGHRDCRFGTCEESAAACKCKPY